MKRAIRARIAADLADELQAKANFWFDAARSFKSYRFGLKHYEIAYNLTDRVARLRAFAAAI